MKTSRKSAFTLVELMIVVGLIGLLAAIAVPSFVRAQTASMQTTCINNLRQVRGAIVQWALDANTSMTTPVTYTNIMPYLRASVVCPSGGTSCSDSYLVIDVQTPPTCKQVPDGPNAHILPTDISQ